jgi:hypothetical protein
MNPISTIAGLRAAVVAGAWLAPNLSGKLFGLDPDANPQASYLARLFGIRDIALAAGALGTDGDARRKWVQLGLVCDVADAAAAYLGGRNGTLPKPAAVMTGVTALVAAGMGVQALSE